MTAYERFFTELTIRTDAAKEVEQRLDRELAHRFNVFDYLGPDELRLSRALARLLEPNQSHGQGTLFLRALLNAFRLTAETGWPDLTHPGVSVRVDTEHTTRAGRSIDIVVQIVDADGTVYGFAIENKPYAGDLKNQIRDYLEYLKESYSERFLLVYLSPSGDGPSDDSIARETLGEWTSHLAIMPYHGGSEAPSDDYDSFRIDHSLADWITECRKCCDAERLRSFLRDFEACCKEIGGETMTRSVETTVLSDFVLSNPDSLLAAQAVYDSWPDILRRVGQRFVEAVRYRIETSIKSQDTLKAFAPDMHWRYRYDERSYKSHISLFRQSWTEYPVKLEINRTSIQLNNSGKGPSLWYVGVCSPMKTPEMPPEYRERRQRLDKALNDVLRGGSGRSTESWPWYRYLDADKRDWRQLVPQLYRECEEPGEISEYYVDTFTGIAAKAIPLINDIEGQQDT